MFIVLYQDRTTDYAQIQVEECKNEYELTRFLEYGMYLGLKINNIYEGKELEFQASFNLKEKKKE